MKNKIVKEIKKCIEYYNIVKNDLIDNNSFTEDLNFSFIILQHINNGESKFKYFKIDDELNFINI